VFLTLTVKGVIRRAATACGTLLGFWWGAATSFVGMTLGTTVGFFIARGIKASFRQCDTDIPVCDNVSKAQTGMSVPHCLNAHSRLQPWFDRHGVLALAALRPVPMLAEASVFFAGASALPAKRVLLTLTLSNAAVSALYAGIGALGVGFGGIALAFLASILVAGSLMLLFRPR